MAAEDENFHADVSLRSFQYFGGLIEDSIPAQKDDDENVLSGLKLAELKDLIHSINDSVANERFQQEGFF